MRHDILDGVHDLGHAGLVVGAEQRGAVGGDDRLALVREQLRELRGAQREARHALQGNVGAVVVRDDLRLDAGAGRVGRRVHMGDEAHGRDLLVDVGRDGGHYIAPFVQRRLDAEREQLVTQHAQQVQLLGFGGLAFALLVGLGVHRHIAEETV